jgi:hypothetical protein
MLQGHDLNRMRHFLASNLQGFVSVFAIYVKAMHDI